MKTLTGSSVRARSATGQVTKSLGKKTVNFDINGIAAGVNMEVLKISMPIVSAAKMVRSGRRIVLDEHDFFIEDKKTGKRIPVELTRDDVFVLICPNDVDEAEGPGQEELDKSIPDPDAVPRGVAVPETPSDKNREAHELTHLPRSRGAACVIDVKGAGDKYAISSARSFLKELGYTRFRCRTDFEPAIKAMVDAVIKCLSDDRVVEQILPEETIPESHASMGALEGWHNLLQGQSLVVLISACRGL